VGVSVRAVARAAGFPGALAAVTWALGSAYSLLRDARMNSAGYDLGIFDQAVRSYAGFHAPIAPIKGPHYNLLGDHFHPILATLAPYYRIWPSARMLLVAQAFLVGLSVLPVARLALRRIPGWGGYAVSIAYALSWGLQNLVAFDFHEVAFAVPILAFAMCALAEERWRAALLWSLLLPLVKEDMGLTVAGVGCLLCLKRQWRLGLLAIVGGLAVTAVTVQWLVPFFNPAGKYPYANAAEGSLNPLDLFLPGARAQLLVALPATTGLAALRSPLLLVGLPNMLERLHSPNHNYWSVWLYHYNAFLMPIVFVALVDAIPALRASSREWLRWYGRYVPALVLAISVAVIPLFPFESFFKPSFYTSTPEERAAGRLLSRIPDGAHVSASNYLAPHLTDRTTVVLFPHLTDPRPVRWVIVSTRHLSGVPAPASAQLRALAPLPSQGFRLVAEEQGIELYER
jgi:uncharacterized membrane protein